MQPVPHPGFLPVAQPPPARHARAAPHLLRKHLPWNARAQHKENAGERRAVRYPRAPALGLGLLGRQQRLDEGPKFVAYECFCHAGQLKADGAISRF